MNTNTSADRGQTILAEMGSIPVIVPGKLCERHGEGGKVTGWKLQRWHNGHNETRYIPAELVARVQEGTEGHQRFMNLAREYAEVRGEEALQETRRAENSKKSS